jgi:ABC-type dipeptide/oligopeptide/nickel transport system permease component
MIKSVGSAVAIVFTVHAITYALVGALPNAAISALGLLGGNAAAVSAFWQSRKLLPYPQHLANVVHGDFGLTINQVPVFGEVMQALGSSVPVIIAALVIAVLLVVWLFQNYKSTQQRRTVAFFDFLNFIPPFFIPFFAGALIFATIYAGNAVILRLALLVSLALPVYFMLASTLLRLRGDEDGQIYPSALAANGVAQVEITMSILKVAVSKLAGTFDRAVVIAVVCLMLAEPTLGLPGLGTLTARAVRTADPNLTIGVTVATALIAVIMGTIVSWTGKAYGMWAGRSP